MNIRDLFDGFRRKPDVSTEEDTKPQNYDEEYLANKNKGNDVIVDRVSSASSGAAGDENLQEGVKDIQAVSTVWSTSHLVMAYILCVALLSSLSPHLLTL